MKKYMNASGNSGVSAYESGPDWIKIEFKTGNVYKYSYISAGKQHVDQMKNLAELGYGLATYINKHVKELYE